MNDARFSVRGLPCDATTVLIPAEAVAAVKRDLIAEPPKMRRARRTDVSDLQVSFNELTPVSEPLYAVA